MREADTQLKIFNDDFGNFFKLKFILENSTNNYARYLSASALKNQIQDNWSKLPSEEKKWVKQYILTFLMTPSMVLGVQTYQKEVTKMMMLLLAKMAKVAWLDDPDIKNEIVPELTKLISQQDPRHKMIGLQAID